MAARHTRQQPFLWPTCSTPVLSRHGFTTGSYGSHGVALVCPARTLGAGSERFVPACLGTPTVAPVSAFASVPRERRRLQRWFWRFNRSSRTVQGSSFLTSVDLPSFLISTGPRSTWRAGSMFWAIERLRVYLRDKQSSHFSDHKALESIGKVGSHQARVQRWLEALSRSSIN